MSEEAIRSEEATTLETLIRRRARGLIDAIVAEEVEAALGAPESARVGPARQGYRHGTRERTLTTSLGPTTFAMPRARVRTAAGATAAWRSALVPRYQRRSERVDEAILGVYLSGTNTRRIKGALAPLLRGGPLSKDAVSRLVGRLADDFETWRRRDLAEDQIQYLPIADDELRDVEVHLDRFGTWAGIRPSVANDGCAREEARCPIQADPNERHLSNRTMKGLKIRYIPVSPLQQAMLELRRYDPAGRQFGPNADVFSSRRRRRSTRGFNGSTRTAAERRGLSVGGRAGRDAQGLARGHKKGTSW
ncbi:MAG: hypothetical protein PVSMB1_17630 [Gemmatimonadaceae bacterium]